MSKRDPSSISLSLSFLSLPLSLPLSLQGKKKKLRKKEKKTTSFPFGVTCRSPAPCASRLETLPSTVRLGASNRWLPFVDPSNPSAGLYWSGAHFSTPPFAASQLQSIPTPPSSEAGRSSGPTRDTTANVAAAVAHPTSMHPGPAPMGAPPSFATRRPHAAQLGNFELPPPTHKHSTFNTINGPQSSSQAPTTIASVGNLLTPPNNIPGDVISPSSGVSTSSANSTVMPYSNNPGYMFSPPPQPSSHYGYGGGQQNHYSSNRGGTLTCLQNVPPASGGGAD